MDRPEPQALTAGTTSGSGAGQGIGAGPAPDTIAGLEAQVVLSSGGSAVRYEMFEVLAVSPDGATLRGGLLLEVSEELTLEVRLPDRTVLSARARVVEILHGRPPAMKVVWTGVPEADRRRLADSER